MAWKVRLLRLTLFAPSEEGRAAISALQWEDLTGSKPAQSQTKGEQEQQEGPFPPGRLLLQKELGRLDLLYAGSTEEDAPETEAPVATVGPLEPAVQALRGLAASVFGRIGGRCIRLALGADLVEPAESAQAAYKTLVDQIRSTKFNLDGAQEFVYQLNRPRESQVLAALTVNRLTRWHAASWRPIRFQLMPGSTPTVIQQPPQFGALITTDVNTAGTRTEPLPENQLLALYDELCSLTVEIRDKGDVP